MRDLQKIKSISLILTELWSVDEFAAILAGLTPEKFREITEKKDDYSSKEINRCLIACRVSGMYLKSLEKDMLEISKLCDSGWHMSPWKFIKWLAQSKAGAHTRFINALPRTLIELYLEFTPLNVDYRTQPKNSVRYHRALYIKHAQFVYDSSPKKLSPKEIYRHPHMQEILYTIRTSGGHPKERTITESWLKDIDDDRQRGRPPKK